MREIGTVAAVREGEVDVLIRPSESCESCGICTEGAGGHRLLEGVANGLNVGAGDTVTVETPDAARHRAQVRVYVIPVIALVVGYLAGFLLSKSIGIDSDTGGAVCALLAGAAALMMVPRHTVGSQGEPTVRDIIARSYPPDSQGPAGLKNHIPN